jgi:hypothetical protein
MRRPMFDLRRFGRLAVTQWAEYGRSWLWFLGIGIAVHLCVLLLTIQGGRAAERYSIDTQMAIYLAGYLITGGLFALRYFSALSDRDSALTCLMRPASTFEKFLLALLVVAVLYPLAYTLAFQVCNLPGAYLGEAARDALIAGTTADRLLPYYQRLQYGPYLPLLGTGTFREQLQVLLGNLCLQALILAGTLYFRRVAWLKTTLALFILLVLALPLLTIATDAWPSLLFVDYQTRTDLLQVRVWLALLWLGVPLLVWTSVFFLLKERELR